MFGTISAIALIVGNVSTTMVLTEESRLAAEETREPVVEVRAAESPRTPSNNESAR